jgi:acetylornithine/N-succinyldiaminopimelate aminotransferase
MALSEELVAQALKQDSRVQQAKHLLLEALQDHQKQISQVRPPQSNLRISYSKLLTEFAECRGSNLYFPYIGSGIGNGPFVELLDGSIKYDFIGGIGPHYWGHSHSEMVSASIDAALEDIVMQGNLQQNKKALDFCQLLMKTSHMSHCFLTSSGAMSNENAFKIAFQKKFPADRILAFDRCFLGRTLVLSQVTDKASFREGLPLNVKVDYVPFYDPKKPEESTDLALSILKKHLSRYPQQHALMCFELVQGEGGFYTAPREFFVKIMTLLKEHGILIFDDEIQSFGRTSQLFTFQHFGLEDYVDIVSVGKLSQICATLFRKEVVPRPGLLSQTFIGSTSALHAGYHLIKALLSGEFFGPHGKIQQIHDQFVSHFKQIQERHPGIIHGPFGVGTMIGFTLLDGDNQKTAKFVQDLFQAGVMSFVAGTNPTRVRFLVPVGVLTSKHIEDAMQIIEATLIKTAQQEKSS